MARRLWPIAFALFAGCGDVRAPGDDPRADPRDTSKVSAGAKIYAQHCAACHGAKLEGQANWRARLPNGRLPSSRDTASYVWGFWWVAHQVTHLGNPWFTSQMAAPVGADRFYNLVKIGYYDNVRFFRAVEGFMVQFGIHGDPAVSRAWRAANLMDDPVKQSNKRWSITYATAGPNTRAGFIAAPVSGPPNKMSSVIVDPITRPATYRGPRSSTAVP